MPMKATDLLERQHRKVEAIFKKLESGRSAPAPLLRELADSLAAHMAIEQEIFYPAIRSLKEDLVAESFEEHAVAELALKRLLSTAPSGDSFMAKVTTLKELIEHHVEEEEKELFPVVEKKMEDARLEALGKEMRVAFEAAVARGFDALVPKSMASTSADLANDRRPKKPGPVVKDGQARAANARS
jgi:hemerythrin-like domain-containing protein